MNIFQIKVTPRILAIVLSIVISIVAFSCYKFDSHMKEVFKKNLRDKNEERLFGWLGRYVLLGETRLYIYDTDLDTGKIKCISSNGTLIDLDTYQVTLEPRK